jgi:hypothetical protein
MTVRRIHQGDGSLPPLSLPPGALAKTDHQHHYDTVDEPPAIEPIEHRIRLDFMAGGAIRRSQLLDRHKPWTADPGEPDPWQEARRSKPVGLQYAEDSCRRILAEERRYYDRFEADQSADLEDVPAFLAHRLRACRDAEDPQAALKDEQVRRERWYSTIIPWMNLYHVLKRSSYGSLLPNSVESSVDIDGLTERNAFVGMVVVDDHADIRAIAREYGVSGRFVVRETELSSSAVECAPLPSEFGIDLPAPLLVGKYASGSRYALLPWSDGLVCSCPYKHDRPWRVLCKHELLAAVVAGEEDSIFLPVTQGLDVPHRARRFVNPEIAATHTPHVGTHRERT